MNENPSDLLAQADRLESQLQDLQAELVERQEILDRTLREQSERIRKKEIERLEESESKLLSTLAILYAAHKGEQEWKQDLDDVRTVLAREEWEQRQALASAREARLFTWIWLILGVFPIALLLLSLLDLGNDFLIWTGLSLLTFQGAAFYRARSARKHLKDRRRGNSEE
jgi:hypothetical protein